MGTTEPPGTGTTYPPGAEPFEDQELEVIPVDIPPNDGTRRGAVPIVPIVVAVGKEVGKQIAATLINKGGEYVISKAWNAATKVPVINFERPPVVYNQATGMLFRLQANGNYLPSGTAIMR